MANLIAYIPVFNAQYEKWIEQNQPDYLYLISTETAVELLPRLSRNLAALPAHKVGISIRAVMGVTTCVMRQLEVQLGFLSSGEYVMPNEDLSHKFAETYLLPRGYAVKFESVWGRWDMVAVKRQEPILPDCEVSVDQLDIVRLQEIQRLAKRSSDWWRQIGAMAVKNGGVLASCFNQHFPTEYEVSIFGDPRLNFDAGTYPDVYLSLHAERMIIASCARQGISLGGASLYVTTFPCADCCRWIAMSGVKEVFFFEGYSVLKGFETLKAAGIRIVQVKSPESA